MIGAINTIVSYSESDMLKYFQENNYTQEMIVQLCSEVEEMIDSSEKELEKLQGRGEYDYECGGYWYCEKDRIKIDEVSNFISDLRYTLSIAESYNV